MSGPVKRCPDCSVEMEQMKLRTSTESEKVRIVTDEPREGLLGRLGAKEKYNIVPYVCPECSLTRLYADIDG